MHGVYCDRNIWHLGNGPSTNRDLYSMISWEYSGTILGYIITNLICCFGFQMASLASWSFNQRLNFGCEWKSFSQTVGGTFMGIQWDKNRIYPHWSQNIWWRAAGKFRNWRCFFFRWENHRSRVVVNDRNSWGFSQCSNFLAEERDGTLNSKVNLSIFLGLPFNPVYYRGIFRFYHYMIFVCICSIHKPVLVGWFRDIIDKQLCPIIKKMSPFQSISLFGWLTQMNVFEWITIFECIYHILFTRR